MNFNYRPKVYLDLREYLKTSALIFHPKICFNGFAQKKDQIDRDISVTLSAHQCNVGQFSPAKNYKISKTCHCFGHFAPQNGISNLRVE